MTTSNESDLAALAAGLDGIGIPAAVVGPDNRIMSANNCLLQIIACPLEAAVGEDLQVLLHAVATETAFYENGETAFRLHRVGQTDHWIRMKLDPPGTNRIATLADVGQEWGMLRRLFNAVESRDALLERADIGFWRIDPNVDLLGGTVAGARRMGRPNATMSREEFRKIVHPDDQEKALGAFGHVARNGGQELIMLRRASSDGAGWRHVRVLVQSGRKLPGGRYEVHGLSQDLTEVVVARDRSEAVSKRLELALQASRAVVFERDIKTKALWVSPQIETLFGVSGLLDGSKDLIDVFHEEDRAEYEASRGRAFRGEPNGSFEGRITPDGKEPFWVRLVGRMHFDEAGEPSRFIGLIQDIDELKRQEMALVEAKQAAESAGVAKANFLAAMSHEIRTPLNGVLGMAQLLADADLPAEQIERVQVIMDSGRTLMALLNDVLDLSKIEAGKLEVTRVAGDLATAVRRVRQLFEVKAQERGLFLKLEMDEGIPPILSFDPVRVRQCLANLLSNAVKFTEHGGVTMRLGVSQIAGQSDWRVSVAVRDTGIGMDEEAMSRLFAPFSQADASTVRRFGGTGLGLSITRRLAWLMGGDIEVASRPGAGSEFVFTFVAGEANDENAVPVAAAKASDSADLIVRMRNRRILVVDDNPINRQVVKLFLAPFRPDFAEAADGVEALKRLNEEPFDIVLLDVHMPVMDGRDTIREIRSRPSSYRDIPVVALTADAMSGDKERFLAMGMNAYVSKPIDQRDLLAKIAALLGGSLEEQDAGPAALTLRA